VNKSLSGIQLPTTADDALLDNWYHSIELPGGLVSKGHFDHRSIVDRYGIPARLDGKTALDVGTGDGFFAFEMERRGAKRVVAVDVDYLSECDWVPRARNFYPAETMQSSAWRDHFSIAHKLLGSNVERIKCSVYDLSPEVAGTFDVVFCGDLLLHLQNPMKALINIRSVAKDLAIIETVVDENLERDYPDRPYVRFGSKEEEESIGASNTFWRPNTRALEDWLIYADFAEVHPQGLFFLPPYQLQVTSVVASVGTLEA